MRRLDRALTPLFPIGLPGALIPTSYLLARALDRRGLAGGPAIVTSAWLGWLGQRAIKLLYLRERPRRAGVKRRVDSYPSGHTTGTTAVAATVASILWRRQIISRSQARLLAVGAPILMGAYRVISDEHWATDVLGGWLCGATIALTCTALLGDAGGQSERRNARLALSPRAPRVRAAIG